MKLYQFLFVLLFIGLNSCSPQELLVSHSNPQLAYQGRIQKTKEASEFSWSGTSIKIKFKGKSLYALMKDENGKNYYNVIINQNDQKILNVDSVEKYYPLATNLPNGVHEIELFKRTEWDKGKTIFKGFKIIGKPKLLKSESLTKRKIEVYGNSISAGYAVDDLEGKERKDSIFTNAYNAYPAILARHFNAEYRCICKSGIGLTLSWFPLIMPDLYNRLDPTDSTSHWNFKNYQPDLVIVNLFQNDSWLVTKPERKEFIDTFGNAVPNDDYFIKAYKNFISKIRQKYPDAHIICTLGNMDITKEGSKWIEFVEEAVRQLNDSKIYSHIIPYKGTRGHPSQIEQQAIANSLIKLINDKHIW